MIVYPLSNKMEYYTGIIKLNIMFRYIILNEQKQEIVRDYQGNVVQFDIYDNANEWASGLFGSWVVLKQQLTRGIWMTIVPSYATP